MNEHLPKFMSVADYSCNRVGNYLRLEGNGGVARPVFFCVSVFEHIVKRTNRKEIRKSGTGIIKLNRFAFSGAKVKVVIRKISALSRAGKLNVTRIFFRRDRNIYPPGLEVSLKRENRVKKRKLVVFAENAPVFAEQSAAFEKA